MMKKYLFAIPLFLTAFLCACTPKETDDTEDSFFPGIHTEASLAPLDASELFEDRDFDSSYQPDSCITITLSDGDSSCDSNHVTILEDTITITKEGTYYITGSLSDGQIQIDVGDEEKVQLILDHVTVRNSSSAALYVIAADKVFLTTVSGSDNHLESTGEYVAIDDNEVDGAIFSKSDLTLNGDGQLHILSTHGHGIVSKDDLILTEGTYHVTAALCALSGKDSVRIADGDYTLDAGTDALHSEHTDLTKGFLFLSGGHFAITCGSDAMDASSIVQITGGTYEIAATDDGIHADYNFYLMGGTIDITSSYEGCEATFIEISGGELTLASSDDGINAAISYETEAEASSDGVSDCYIHICGGTIHLDADGDGIDTNGVLLVSGGTILIAGPDSHDNAALDYSGTATITGGTFIATGASGMAMNFASDSTQASILVTFSQSTDETICVTDVEGNVLMTFAPGKNYTSAVISSPDLTVGNTYVITAGSRSITIELNELIHTLSDVDSGSPPHDGKSMPPADFGNRPPQPPAPGSH